MRLGRQKALRPRAAMQSEEGLDACADLCFQPAGLQDTDTGACLIELMVLRELVFALCVYSNKIHCPLPFTVTDKPGN